MLYCLVIQTYRAKKKIKERKKSQEVVAVSQKSDGAWGGGPRSGWGARQGGGCFRVLAAFCPFLRLGSHSLHRVYSLLLCSNAHLGVTDLSFVLYCTIKMSLKNTVSEVPLTCLYQGMFPPSYFWWPGNTNILHDFSERWVYCIENILL